MDLELIRHLRADLRAADYRSAAVRGLLGEDADAARRRGVFVPAARALAERDASPLATLIRVFLLGEAVSAELLDAALPTLGAQGARELELVADTPAGLRAALSLNPETVPDARSDTPPEWWILSDLDDQLRRGPARPDHVMGVGGATRSLIAQAPTSDAVLSLDLGTGCGIVALHLALRGGRVIATDISDRALRLAAANAVLNGMAHAIEFRRGSLLAPVAGERFDLILSNPPFVITPRTGDVPVYEYRDGGLVGDALAAAVVREAPAALAPDGTLLCLANWETPWGGNGLQRVGEWLTAAAVPLTAWVIERDRVSPAQYAETWARDGGARPGSAEFDALLTAWLDDFAARRIVAIGLGSIRIRREDAVAREHTGPDHAGPDHAVPDHTAESVIHVEQATGAWSEDALGQALERAFAAGSTAARFSDAEVLAHRWLVSDSVAEERVHDPGSDAPRAITLVTDRPIARRVMADPLLAAAVGASDGDLTLGQIADALAQLLEVAPAAARAAVVAGARELAWLGMLRPALPDEVDDPANQ